jgi:hypothetical protein
MNIDKAVDAWYAENTDGLDNEIMNAILSNLAFALIEEDIIDEIRADTGLDEELELDNDFGDEYWNGYKFVSKPGDYYAGDYSW